MERRYPEGLRGDILRLLSSEGTHAGKPSLAKAIQRAITRHASEPSD